MITPQIPYYDIDNVLLERNNSYDVHTTVNQFSWTLLNALNGIVVNDPNTPPVSPISNPFYPNPSGTLDTSVTYVSGEFPSAKCRFYFAPTAWSLGLVFEYEFFDKDRFTITSVDVPSVTARFDNSNIDQGRLRLFCYSIIGTLMPVLMDQVSSAYYTGTDPNNYSAPL